MNYKLAFALGLIAPGTVGREPVAYLYNGVRLPGLPEWDKTKYPYAFIWTYRGIGETAFGTSRLYLTTVPWSYNGTSYKIASHHGYLYYDAEQGDAEWGNFASGELEERSYSDAMGVFWSNHDVINTKDGTVYLAKSEPIPVYE